MHKKDVEKYLWRYYHVPSKHLANSVFQNYDVSLRKTIPAVKIYLMNNLMQVNMNPCRSVSSHPDP